MSFFSPNTKVSSPHALQRKLLLILLTSVTAVSVLLGLLYNAGMRQTLMDPRPLLAPRIDPPGHRTRP